ncbi:MAG: DMT family transporter [Patescibacteria group bacterium]
MNNKNKGLLLVFSTAIISGFSIFINKYGVAMANPDIFVFAKNIFVAFLLGAAILLFKKRQELYHLTKKQWGQLALIGLIGGSIPFILFFKGLAMTSALPGAFTHKTMFIFTALLAAIWLKEKINKNFLIGGLLLLLGILLTLKSFQFSFGWGDGLILLAVLFWSIENILAKYLLRDLSGSLVAWGRMFFGSIIIFAYLAFTGQAPQLLALNLTQLGWIALTSALLFGYVITWYHGLKFVPVSVATTILLLGLPITTTLTAFATGKLVPQEVISGSLILAGLLIIFGLKIVKTINNKLLAANR